MAEEAATLRPCPFDSGEAYLQSQDGRYMVGCMTCFCTIGDTFDNSFVGEAEAIAAWNRRAEDGWVAVTPETGITSIAAERKRQVEKEGWTPEHDDRHTSGELAEAAHCYAATAVYHAQGWDMKRVPEYLSWPWDADLWKPSPDPIRNLVKAGALIAAEIDRLQRRESIQDSNNLNAAVEEGRKSEEQRNV